MLMSWGVHLKDVLNAETPEPSRRGRLDLTSNEWMQKAGELEVKLDRAQAKRFKWEDRALVAEAELERLREELTLAKVEATAASEESGELQAELERLRAELDLSGMGDYNRLAARLRRIEEAAREHLHHWQGKKASHDTLRAALEEK